MALASRSKRLLSQGGGEDNGDYNVRLVHWQDSLQRRYQRVGRQDISRWDTSAVTDMSSMFNGATEINQPLATWNTGAVTAKSCLTLRRCLASV